MSRTGIYKIRRWTRNRLSEDDYRFAISGKRDTWDSLSHQLWKCGCPGKAGKWVIAAMHEWEIFRELENNTETAFLAVKQNQERIARILDKRNWLKPADLDPLHEIPLVDAIEQSQEFSHRVQTGMSVHAFKIERDEETDTSVQRFRNWLVRHKSTPDSRSWAASLKTAFRKRGRLNYDATLRAIAVYRLKMAGFKRQEVEEKLGLKRYFLSRRIDGQTGHGHGTDYWYKLPKAAEEAIGHLVSQLVELDSLLGSSESKTFSSQKGEGIP